MNFPGKIEKRALLCSDFLALRRSHSHSFYKKMSCTLHSCLHYNILNFYQQSPRAACITPELETKRGQLKLQTTKKVRNKRRTAYSAVEFLHRIWAAFPKSSLYTKPTSSTVGLHFSSETKKNKMIMLNLFTVTKRHCNRNQ